MKKINYREKTPQVKKQTSRNRCASKRKIAFERMNMLCPGDEFVQIALGQEIQDPLERLLFELRTLCKRLPNKFRTLFRIFENTSDNKKDILILQKLTSKLFLIIFESTFDHSHKKMAML